MSAHTPHHPNHETHRLALPPLPGYSVGAAQYFTEDEVKREFPGLDLPSDDTPVVIDGIDEGQTCRRISRLQKEDGYEAAFVVETFNAESEA